MSALRSANDAQPYSQAGRAYGAPLTFTLGIRRTPLSNDANFLLSFELTTDGDELVVHGDVAGFHALARHIEQLISHTPPDSMEHAHLKTPAWGGSELSAEGQGGNPINHVRLVCWKK